MRKILVTIVLLFALMPLMAQSDVPTANYRVVPLPQQIITTKGAPFVLNARTPIVVAVGNDDLLRHAEFLRDYLEQTAGLRLEITTNKRARNAICLQLNRKMQGSEAYRIGISAKGIVAESATTAGLFYAIQTLRKAMPQGCFTAVSMPAATISDAPRFSYRGMHLDCARHFFSIDFVKRYIDLLALHNMNTFHWHLSDDQGWRIEILRYPRLTEVGSVRAHTVVGRNAGIFDETPYGGYYTQQEARDIVSYAAQRHITVIPEIDMPGHILALLAAYPELGCTGGPYAVEPTWGVFDDILCAGNDRVFTVVGDILDELIDIFPSKYIHIGGDEAPKKRWEQCPRCQQRIRDEHITTESIQQLRKQIDDLDNQLMEILSKRMAVCREIGHYKKEHNMTVLQASRYNEILEKRGVQGTLTGMGAEFVAKVFESIHEESVRQQIEIVNK
jgi:hexosaminidase